MEDMNVKNFFEYGYSDVSLDDIKKFLHQNPHYLQNEVNPYSVDKLMMLLDNDKLSALEEEFNEHPSGIQLPDFVLLLRSTIVHPPEDKFRLISGLIKLFQDIDINGDGHLEWSEFTQYIIDAVIGEKDAKFFDARFEKDREFTEHEIVDKAYSKKSKRYVMSRNIDNTIHSNQIKKICYCAQNDILAVIEDGAKKIKMYTSENAVIKDTYEPVFEEKAFILDCCYSEKLNMIACVASDRRVMIWENSPTKREILTSKHDVLPTGIWFLENHGVWVIAGVDNGLRTFKYGTNDKTPSLGDKTVLLSHTKKITDVVEITIPKLIASSSLDGTIKLWDLSDKVFITELKDSSNARGVRGMTYSFDYGGNLLSFGFESYINIWCPEVSVTRSYVGKLEGHSHTIVCCKFISGSPNCISVDEKGNIRIWDIRSLSTVQLISSENTSIIVNELAIIPKHDKFVLGGKRMTFFDNTATSQSVKHFNDDLYPIHCSYNQYYQTLIILTKIDVRVYDILTGKLKKVFTDLTDEKFSNSDLSSFTFGGKHRKFYLGDNSGNVRLYNMKNGELIHKVSKLDEGEKIDRTKELERKKSNKKRENAEISELIYLTDEKLLITASWDSTIRIYDESEGDESNLLRIISGGHRDSDINAMAHSSHLNLLASGSANGLIAIWDLGLVKLEAICLGHTSEITSLQFAEPFPILISASTDGSICIWGVRPCVKLFRYKCILRMLNSVWKDDETEIRIGITSLTIETGSCVGIQRKVSESSFPKPDKYQKYIMKSLDKKRESRTDFGSTFKSNNKAPTDLENKSYHNFASEGSKNLDTEFLQEVLFCPSNKIYNNSEYYESLENFAEYRETHDDDYEMEKGRCYVYFGDQKGYMNVLDLTKFLKKKDIGPCKNIKSTDSYQLKRKEWIDVSKTIDSLLSNEELRKPPFTAHTFNSLLLARWEAHKQSITHINKIEDPPSIITCSVDKFVRVWSLEGNLYGSFNLLKLDKKLWDFPFNWIKKKLREIEDVFAVLNFIEKEETQKVSLKEKESIKLKHILTSFGNHSEFLDTIRSYKNCINIKKERNSEPLMKQKESLKKENEAAYLLQAEMEGIEKNHEQDNERDKEKLKGKIRIRGKEEKKDNIDLKTAKDFRGFALKVFQSLEAYEKGGIRKENSFIHQQNQKSILKQKTDRSQASRTLELAKRLIEKRFNKEHFNKPVVSRARSYSSKINKPNENFKQNNFILPAIDKPSEDVTKTQELPHIQHGDLSISKSYSSRPLFNKHRTNSLESNIFYARPEKRKLLEIEEIKKEKGHKSVKILAKNQIGMVNSISQHILATDRRESLASFFENYRNVGSQNNLIGARSGSLTERSDAEKSKIKIRNSNSKIFNL